MSYTWNPEGERIANTLIDEYHPHLRGIDIAYLFKAKPAEVTVAEHTPVDSPRPARRQRKPKTGKVWIAKCTRLPDKLRILFARDYKFMITADQEIWDELSETQRKAVIDHELAHAVLDEDGNPRLRRHDLEEFRSVVERHGTYLADIRMFAEALERNKRRTDEVI